MGRGRTGAGHGRRPRDRTRLLLGTALGGALLWILGVGGRGVASAADRPRYELSVTLDTAASTITGRAVVHFTNPGPRSIDRVGLDLYPNRFRSDGDEVNDITRESVYPRLEFEPGGIAIDRVARVAERSADGDGADTAASTRPAGDEARPLPFLLPDVAGLPPGGALEVELGSPLGPGATIALEIDFRTTVPRRYGPFGANDAGVVAVAGWYPLLSELAADGTWVHGAAPRAADVAAEVVVSGDLVVVLGSEVFPTGHAGRVRAGASDVRTFALIAYPRATIVTAEKDGTRATFVRPDFQFTQRVGFGPGPAERLRSTVEDAVAGRPPELAAPASLVVVQAPLRWNLTTPSDGPVVVSDRAMDVQELLRGFHESQVAQAVYAELLREEVFAREAPADRQWVQQTVAWDLADRYVRARRPEHRDVHWWIRGLDSFAIVDRFESAPKIPFVQSFFENAQSDDDLRENVYSWARPRAPARLVLARLDREYGDEVVANAVDDYLAAPRSDPGDEGPITAHGPGSKGPPPVEGDAAGAPMNFADALSRAADQPVEATDAALAGVLVPPPTGRTAVVDPTLRPGVGRSRYQLVLDTADIEVSSTEFGLAALFVARKRYDYTKDFAINPFFTERSYGVNAGPRLHFGERNDANTYRHNLIAFFNFSKLDGGFEDDRTPDRRTYGKVAGFGTRYDYSNVYFYDNPTRQREARLFADWFDTAFGSDYGFVRFGARGSLVTPLWTPRTLGAIDVLAGFEQPVDDRGVPIQEQYSLGGRRAIRGVSVNARLARNIGLARFELRQDVFPEVDLDFLDILTYRRPQLQFFVDTGQVDDSAGRALNPEHWAVGAGLGVNALYDFLGFFPGRAYIEVATRLDRDQTDFQFLFGTRQAF